MPLFVCLTPPATVEIVVGGIKETYHFPDSTAVNVSNAAALLLRPQEQDTFEEVL